MNKTLNLSQKQQAKSRDEQIEQLHKQCRKIIVNGKVVLVAPRGLSVSNKVYNNID